MKRKAYCTAGALCSPPSNLAGSTEYVADVRFPSCWIAEPLVPACDDTLNAGCSCQHSRMETLFAAEMAVRFNEEGGAAATVETRKAGAANDRLKDRMGCMVHSF